MAEVCASILVVLGLTWVVRRAMVGAADTPLTAAGRRRWVFFSLLASLPVHGVLAAVGLLPWETLLVPACLLVVWLALCRTMVRPPRSSRALPRQTALVSRLSPAPLALTCASILACWVAVNPTGERHDGPVAAATAARAPEVASRAPISQVDPAASTRVRQPARAATTTARRTRQPGSVVMATRGAIVYVGNNGQLTASTGPTSASGTVALGVEDSDLRSGPSSGGETSTQSTAARQGTRSRQQTAARQGTTVQPGTAARQSATARRGGSGTSSKPPPFPHGNGTLADLVKRAKARNATALSGLEDHSVSVVGDDQIVTYDDSNVFLDRDGLINANTGDTDSSGLNAVDVVGSTVRAGNSGDGEGGEDAAEEEEEDEGAPSTASERRIDGGRVARPSAPAGPSDDDDAEEGAGEAITIRPPRGQAYGTVTDDGASAATGKNAFVVGADGIDDVSIRTQGRNDIVTYDDSNVTIGGDGRVNAQIGDSDTGGAVVMGLRNADVRAGCEGDLCYSADPSITLAAQILGASGVELTRDQWRQLVEFLIDHQPRERRPRSR